MSQKGSVILWITDNQCVFSYLTKGSKVTHIQRMLISIKKAEYRSKFGYPTKKIEMQNMHFYADLIQLAIFIHIKVDKIKTKI